MTAAELHGFEASSVEADRMVYGAYVMGVLDAWDGVTPPLLADRRSKGEFLPVPRFCLPEGVGPKPLLEIVADYLRRNLALANHMRADEAVRKAVAAKFPCSR